MVLAIILGWIFLSIPTALILGAMLDQLSAPTPVVIYARDAFSKDIHEDIAKVS